MHDADDTELVTLRLRAEDAIARGKAPSHLQALLERILSCAPPASDDATFANRHLAELLIEENPWKAAVHLRRLRSWQQVDDVVEALLGLCHALLGNFYCAVSAYQRALASAPRNPWYHHNLGHLLDVALDQPRRALRHLRLAHRLEPEEHEITASLAHCLARAGFLEESKCLAEEAVRSDQTHEGHRELLAWVVAGAKAEAGPRKGAGGSNPLSGGVHSASLYGAHHVPAGGAGSSLQTSGYSLETSNAVDLESPMTSDDPGLAAAAQRGDSRSPEHPVRSGALRRADAAEGTCVADVERTLEREMRTAGFSPATLDSARALWADFRFGRRLRIHKPESYAAAIEYAIACVQRLEGVTQTSVARRYGIHRCTLANRYLQIRDALALQPGDPRYLQP